MHALTLSWSLCQMTVVVHVVLILLEFTPYKRLKNSFWNSLNREKEISTGLQLIECSRSYLN